MPKTKEEIAAYNKAYNQANKERIAAQRAEYRAKNSDAIREAAAHHRLENREKIRERNRAAYAEDADWRARAASRAAEWNRENKDKRRETMRRYHASEAGKLAHRLKEQGRRAAKARSGGKLSRDLVDRLYKLQRGRCACCGEPLGADFHMDHIMPLALGGMNTDDNIQLLRQSCNNQKHAKHPIDFMRSKGFLL